MSNLILKLFTISTILLSMEANEKDVLRQLTISVGKKFFKCQYVMEYAPQVLNDFLNYWEGNELSYRDTGCAAICMIYELHILDHNGQLHEPNALGFITSGGAEEPMIKSLLELTKKCILEVETEIKKDICLMALELAKCFRTGIQQLEWVPDVSDLMQVETRRSNEHHMKIYYVDDLTFHKTNKDQVETNTTVDTVSSGKNKRDDILVEINRTTSVLRSGLKKAITKENIMFHSAFINIQKVKTDSNKPDKNPLPIKIATIDSDERKAAINLSSSRNKN